MFWGIFLQVAKIKRENPSRSRPESPHCCFSDALVGGAVVASQTESGSQLTREKEKSFNCKEVKQCSYFAPISMALKNLLFYQSATTWNFFLPIYLI